MSFLKCSIAALLISASFVACQKEKEKITPVVSPAEKPAPGAEKTIQGIWIGHSVMSNKSIPAYFSFKIKDQGKLDVLNAAQEVTGTGAWTFNGETFKASYSITATGAAYSVTAAYYSSPDKFNGTWGYNSADNGGGFWEMEKIN